jgi:hypothetical protein
MNFTSVRARTAASGLFATLNALALLALLHISGATSAESVHVVAHKFLRPLGWFGIGLLVSSFAIVLYFFAKLYYRQGYETEFVRVYTLVGSVMSLLMFILGIWEYVRPT